MDMIKQIIFIFLIATLSFSCKKEIKDVTEEPILEIEQEVLISNIGEQLSPEAKGFLNDWKEFQDVAFNLEGYTSITKSQALENANDLSLLVKKIADTIKVDVLERPDMRIRFNVLYNHSLRLQDMATITSISNEEVTDEVTKLLSAFSSINDKINSIYKILEFENQFKELRKRVSDSSNTEEETKPKKPIIKKPLVKSEVPK